MTKRTASPTGDTISAPDYRRITNILRSLPANTPALCVTATANDRVVADIRQQLGDIHIQRGSLMRDNLELQVLQLPSQAARLAWLAEILPKLHNPGIIYTLTTRDAEQVAAWLQENHINAAAYYSGVTHPDYPDSDSYRQHLEACLHRRELQALVATSALGMGYDQPDLSYIFHYQMPNSVIAYYQQVGRAGRGIERAVGVLMSGGEDERIHEYFRDSAFPPESDVRSILHALENSDGLSVPQLEQHCNLRHSQIDKALKLLNVENPAPVLKQGSLWLRTANPYRLDHERIARLTQQREAEWAQMQDYLRSRDCRMNYLRRALDEAVHAPCGKCDNCRDAPPIRRTQPAPETIERAARWLQNRHIIITPRRQLVSRGTLQHHDLPYRLGELAANEGRVLARWGEAGWGEQIAADKHAGHFRDELVAALADYIRRWRPNPAPRWLCNIPSQRHPTLVADFARRLAAQLGLPWVDAIEKIRDNEPQKRQANTYHQCANLDGVFAVHNVRREPVLLIDDITDSGWTFTIAAALLRQAGSGAVHPVLATTATHD